MVRPNYKDTSEVELSEQECPECGHLMVWQRCFIVGCIDGFIENEDNDPLWGQEVELCPECKGEGILEWCKNCGYGC